MIRIDNDRTITYERIGEFHSEGAWIHPNRSISSYEVILVLQGSISLFEEDQKYDLCPGEVLLLEPGKYHGGTQITTEPVAFYWLHFYTELPIAFKYISGVELYEARQLMKRLLHMTNTAGFSENAADAMTLVILEELSFQLQERDMTSRVNVNQIAEYIRMNSHKKITVQGIADHFGYHQDYAGKLFRKYFGVGLKEYIAAQKIKKTKDLLLTTELSVKQISLELGYEQDNLFIKFFLYHEGISPTVFRNQYYHTHMNNR